MNANEILKVLREEYNKEGSRFTVFGLRGEDREMNVGDNCDLSMQEMDDVEPVSYTHLTLPTTSRV